MIAKASGISERYLAIGTRNCPCGRPSLHRNVPQRVRRSFEGTAEWKEINVTRSDTYGWQEDSTYIRLSPFFDEMQATPAPVEDIHGARILAMLGIQSPLTISLRRAVLSPTARRVDIYKVGVLSGKTLTPMVRGVVTMK